MQGWRHGLRRPARWALALAGIWPLAAPAQQQELLQMMDRLRAPGGPCAATAPPLVRRGSLDTLAARLAGGASLEAASRSVDDRMTEVQVLRFTGARQGPQVEAALTRRFCHLIARRNLSAVGVFAQGAQSWIVLAEPFAPSVERTPQQIRERMLALVNAARATPRSCGDHPQEAAPPVRWNARLEQAAGGHASDMAANDYFSHAARDGSTPAQRVTRAGYRYRMTGENIAGGQSTPEEAVAGWLRSPGHCVNLMNPAYREMAVAVAVDARSRLGVYWVQKFGTPR